MAYSSKNTNQRSTNQRSINRRSTDENFNEAAIKPKNIKWNAVNKSFRLPKFKKNLPKWIKNKIFLKEEKIEKIKLAFKKSKIKDKIAIITLNKKAYNNKQTNDIINSPFSELIKSKDKISIQKFFNIYKELFYNIPKKGDKSHESFINQSQDYLNNYIDSKDAQIEQLLEELELKEEELNLKQNSTTNENLFYPNGTFLRTHGFDTEFIDGVPQGLPIWVMQEGMKREFKSYDVYKIAKRAAGFTNMTYDADKNELLGDKDLDILERVHTTDLNYIKTGRDIIEETDLNLPSGPDRKIDISLADILDYYKADLTCLEGIETDNPNEVQPENYALDHDLKSRCHVNWWVLNGTTFKGRSFDPGETIQVYYRKDNPDLNSDDAFLEAQLAGDEDGMWNMKGYIRFDYDHPENEPTKYVNTPILEANTLPNYVPPKLSNYGTRMYQRYGYGDQRPADGSYKSAIPDRLWEQVLDDPNNAFYNHSHKWNEAKKADNIIGSKNGGYRGGEGGYTYSRKIYKWWDGDSEVTRYVVNVGGRNSAMFRAHRAYFVVLDKNYKGKSSLNEGRVKISTKKSASPYFMEELNVALEDNNSRRFPTTEGGFYVPYEYWDVYGLE